MLEQRIEKLESKNAELETKLDHLKSALLIFLESHKEWVSSKKEQDPNLLNIVKTMFITLENHQESLEILLEATGTESNLRQKNNQEKINLLSSELSNDLRKAVETENRGILLTRVEIILNFGERLLKKFSKDFKFKHWFDKDFKVDDRSKEELQDFLKSFSEEVESYKS